MVASLLMNRLLWEAVAGEHGLIERLNYLQVPHMPNNYPALVLKSCHSRTSLPLGCNSRIILGLFAAPERWPRNVKNPDFRGSYEKRYTPGL